MDDNKIDNIDQILNYFCSKYHYILLSLYNRIDVLSFKNADQDDINTLYLNTVYKAIISYNEKMSSFETYLSRLLEFALKQYRCKLMKESNTLSLDDVMATYPGGDQLTRGDFVVGEAEFEPNFDDPGPLSVIQDKVLAEYDDTIKEIWFEYLDGITIKMLAYEYKIEYYRLRYIINSIKKKIKKLATRDKK